jgi:hypothetical protein
MRQCSVGFEWSPDAPPVSASVAPASAAPDFLAACRAFFAEINVIVHGLLRWIGHEAHLLLGEEVAIPRVDGRASASERGDDRRERG